MEVALGAGFLLLSALLALREMGVWFSDAIVWPVVLVGAGGALLWRQSAVAGARDGAGCHGRARRAARSPSRSPRRWPASAR